MRFLSTLSYLLRAASQVRRDESGGASVQNNSTDADIKRPGVCLSERRYATRCCTNSSRPIGASPLHPGIRIRRAQSANVIRGHRDRSAALRYTGRRAVIPRPVVGSHPDYAEPAAARAASPESRPGTRSAPPHMVPPVNVRDRPIAGPPLSRARRPGGDFRGSNGTVGQRWRRSPVVDPEKRVGRLGS